MVRIITLLWAAGLHKSVVGSWPGRLVCHETIGFIDVQGPKAMLMLLETDTES